MHLFGYRNKILRVDLESGSSTVTALDDRMVRKYIGGAGLGIRMLHDMVDSSTNPLSPENPLVFITGPFCGTLVPTGSKSTVCARSPKTGLLGYSTVGGHFGADIRFAGYDGIIITGRAKEPTYLLVEDSDVELRSATHLWGKDTVQVWEQLKKETGHSNPGVARIGIGGENLVKYGTIMMDHHRAAGRTGMGAVMGSKNLKAVVVHGTDRSVPVADPEGLSQYVSELNKDKKEDPTFRMYSDLGTAGYTDMASMLYGSMPAGYYTVGEFDTYGISGSSVRESILVGKAACYRCPIACGRVIEINEGKYATGKFAGPEYEVTGTMGSLILNNNLEAIAYANKQLALLGIDTISAGNTIALAFYLYNEGKITERDLDGVKPEWGDIDAALTLVDKIARREGIGNLMAEGSLQFADRFGYANLAAQVNGLELAQHDPRGFSGLAITYTTSPRGACHMTADMYNVQMGQENPAFEIVSEDRFANEAIITARHQNFRALTNSCVICNFYPVDGSELLRLLNLVTGWEMEMEEFRRTGERIFTMMRLFNLKLGYDPKKEKLPDIIMRPLDGPTEGHVPDVEQQLDTWYEYRDWDRETGRPSEERLKMLDLSDHL